VSEELREDIERTAAKVILDLVNQYAQGEEYMTTYAYYSGGLSVLEDAFIWLVKHGYARGNSEHISLTGKALGLW